MNEIIEDTVEEMNNSLKRAEHSCFVSLKYTRTVDVIKNLVERFTTTLKFVTDVLIEYSFEKGKISEKPNTLIERINLVKELYDSDEKVIELMGYLLFLRRVLRSTFGKCEEFRRHVTMIVKLDGEEHNIDIDYLMEHYESLKNDVKYIENLVMEIKDED